MKTIGRVLWATGVLLTLGATVVLPRLQAQQAQQQQTPPARPPRPPMTFFVTSVGKGNGADLGGLVGADAHCQTLGAAAGRGNVTWRAYLSTQGPNAVNARDRIGKGPWYNAEGQAVARDVAQLHGDTLEEARVGNNFHVGTVLNEKGAPPDGPQHDILTGSTPEGKAVTEGWYSDVRPLPLDRTCNNWTSSGAGFAMVGHSDRRGGGNFSWNSAHQSLGCSQQNLVSTGGGGLFYCFAVN